MPTNAVILDNAPIACVLAGNAIANGSLFGGKIDPLLDQKIYATYFVIKKIYDIDPNYQGMDVRCQYLWEIMSKYGIMAMSYTGGGGSVAPISPSINAPTPLDWIVTVNSTPLAEGESSVLLPQFVGYNVNFNRNGQPQYTTNPNDGSTYYSWNSVTGLFQIFGGVAQLGEAMRIYV